MKKIALLGVILGSLSCASATDPVVAEGNAAVGGHGFYYALGVLATNAGERVDHYGVNGVRYTEVSHMTTQLGAVLALGYQFIPQGKPCCIGLEGGCDFNQRHEDVQADKRSTRNYSYSLRTTRNGFKPFLALRLGYLNYDHKFMVYLKAGMSYVDSAEYYQRYTLNDDNNWILNKDSKVKLNSWMPVVALGLEKEFTKNFTCRGEVEYRFTKTKYRNFREGDGLKLYQKGTFNARVLFCHNIKFGR